MNEEAIIRQIGNLDAAEVKTALHRVHQMQDHLMPSEVLRCMPKRNGSILLT